jgi:hypothetical protein
LPLRDLGQERRVTAVLRLDIPARQVAADLGSALARGVQQQQHADRRAVSVQHVAEAGMVLRRLALRLAAQAGQPVVARAADKAARQ